MNNTDDNNTNKRQAIDSATMANTTDAGSNKTPAIDSIVGITALNEDDCKWQLDGILLKQAIDILHELKFDKCIQGNSNTGYDITNPRLLAQLLTKAQVLVTYVDVFVLEDATHKIKQVTALGDYEKKEDMIEMITMTIFATRQAYQIHSWLYAIGESFQTRSLKQNNDAR